LINTLRPAKKFNAGDKFLSAARRTKYGGTIAVAVPSMPLYVVRGANCINDSGDGPASLRLPFIKETGLFHKILTVKVLRVNQERQGDRHDQ
jgi:hypothetical protein